MSPRSVHQLSRSLLDVNSDVVASYVCIMIEMRKIAKISRIYAQSMLKNSVISLYFWGPRARRHVAIAGLLTDGCCWKGRMWRRVRPAGDGTAPRGLRSAGRSNAHHHSASTQQLARTRSRCSTAIAPRADGRRRCEHQDIISAIAGNRAAKIQNMLCKW